MKLEVTCCHGNFKLHVLLSSIGNCQLPSMFHTYF